MLPLPFVDLPPRCLHSISLYGALFLLYFVLDFLSLSLSLSFGMPAFYPVCNHTPKLIDEQVIIEI